MRKRVTIGFGAVLLVAGLFVLFLLLRGPAQQPRYLRIEKGMDWIQVEEIMRGKPVGTYMSEEGLLRKTYKDVDGNAHVVFDGEVVAQDVEYVPDNPTPGFFERLAKGLRL